MDDNNLFTYANNSPVMYVDSRGYSAVTANIYSQMVAMAASVTALIASLKSTMVMLWNPILVAGCIAAVVVALLAVICAVKAAENIFEVVKKLLKQMKKHIKSMIVKYAYMFLQEKKKGLIPYFM